MIRMLARAEDSAAFVVEVARYLVFHGVLVAVGLAVTALMHAPTCRGVQTFPGAGGRFVLAQTLGHGATFA